MRSRAPAGGLSDSDPRFEIGRQSEAIDEPTGKSAEDPSMLSVGQEAGDPRFELGNSAPARDEGSNKAAEDPSATNW